MKRRSPLPMMPKATIPITAVRTGAIAAAGVEGHFENIKKLV